MGVQIRTFTNNNEWSTPRILKCLTEVSGVLAPPILRENWTALLEAQKAQISEPNPQFVRAVERENSTVVKVYLTSLSGHHPATFKKLYEEGMAQDGATVGFHSSDFPLHPFNPLLLLHPHSFPLCVHFLLWVRFSLFTTFLRFFWDSIPLSFYVSQGNPFVYTS